MMAVQKATDIVVDVGQDSAIFVQEVASRCHCDFREATDIISIALSSPKYRAKTNLVAEKEVEGVEVGVGSVIVHIVGYRVAIPLGTLQVPHTPHRNSWEPLKNWEHIIMI